MSEWAPHVRGQLERLRLDGARESEIIEDLSQHLDQRFDELRREGFSDERARQLAVDELVEPVALGAQMQPLRQSSQPPVLTRYSPRATRVAGETGLACPAAGSTALGVADRRPTMTTTARALAARTVDDPE